MLAVGDLVQRSMPSTSASHCDQSGERAPPPIRSASRGAVPAAASACCASRDREGHAFEDRAVMSPRGRCVLSRPTKAPRTRGIVVRRALAAELGQRTEQRRRRRLRRRARRAARLRSRPGDAAPTSAGSPRPTAPRPSGARAREGVAEGMDRALRRRRERPVVTQRTPEVPSDTKASPARTAPTPTAPAALSPAPPAISGARRKPQRRTHSRRRLAGRLAALDQPRHLLAPHAGGGERRVGPFALADVEPERARRHRTSPRPARRTGASAARPSGSSTLATRAKTSGSCSRTHISLGAVKPGIARLPVTARSSGQPRVERVALRCAAAVVPEDAGAQHPPAASSSVAPCIWPGEADRRDLRERGAHGRLQLVDRRARGPPPVVRILLAEAGPRMAHGQRPARGRPSPGRRRRAAPPSRPRCRGRCRGSARGSPGERHARSRQVVLDEDVDPDPFLRRNHALAAEPGQGKADGGADLVAGVLVDHRVGHAVEQRPPGVRGELVADPDDALGPAARPQRRRRCRGCRRRCCRSPPGRARASGAARPEAGSAPNRRGPRSARAA